MGGAPDIHGTERRTTQALLLSPFPENAPLPGRGHGSRLG